ncbi:MAG TPA: FAD-dependent oxidoreductase [Candidatus Omnitrophota bacterium]|nr:FAD-dependent oxidoreductase [Candidatus Omnitrophota bacterium]
MQEFRGKLIERIERTSNVESFRFALKEKLDFLPGQFVQVIFDEKDRKNGALNKYLSFSCASGKDYIEVTKKISESKFSDKLDSLKVGKEVLFKGPMGKCVFNPAHPKIGFLVGGIGVTPAISIIEHIALQKLPTNVVMVYSNWTVADIAFKEELADWEHENQNIKIIHSVVSEKPKDDKIYTGMITKDLILQTVEDYKDRVWFIFGPPAMVTAMQMVCKNLNLGDERLMIETFMGY